MKLSGCHFVAAAALLASTGALAQDSSLPMAPSAIAAQKGFKVASEMTLSQSPMRMVKANPRVTLNPEQKFSSFVEQSMSPYATISSAALASFRPAWNNSQYPETYAGRLGHSMADQTEQGFFTKFLLPTMLHQDPRYHSSESTGTMSRASYALSRVLVGRKDNGRATLNTSELLGAAIAGSLSSAYHPLRQRTPGEAAGRAAASIGADAGMNMLREFWPDIRGRVLDHGPKVMQSLMLRFGSRVQSADPLPSN
jgi:hypothetical protein